MCHSLRKSCEQIVIIYHAMAVLEGTMLLVTKQAACLQKDQTTRKEAAEGEKLLPDKYLGIVELDYEKTAMQTHEHELGVISKAMRS
jgi:hypothetical protein